FPLLYLIGGFHPPGNPVPLLLGLIVLCVIAAVKPLADKRAAAHHHQEAAEVHEAGHAIPTWLYYLNFTALMALLIVTLLAAHVNLGELNLIIAITIAVIKAVLIVLYFMHLRWGTKLVRVFAGAALFWLGILFVLTL